MTGPGTGGIGLGSRSADRRVLFVGGLGVPRAGRSCATSTRSTSITNRRVIQVEGVINKQATDSSLEKINDAVLTQSHLRPDLRVRRPRRPDRVRGRRSTEFRMLVHPIAFKKAMLDAKHEYERDGRPAPATPCAGPPLRSRRRRLAPAVAAVDRGRTGDDRRVGRRQATTRERRRRRLPRAPAMTPDEVTRDARQPGGPARPGRDHAPRSTRQEGGAARPALSRSTRATVAGRGRLPYADRLTQRACVYQDLLDRAACIAVVVIMLLSGSRSTSSRTPWPRTGWATARPSCSAG